jgi:tellurite resistance protein
LSHPQCLDMPAEGENFVTFDVHTHKRNSSGQFDSRNREKTSQFDHLNFKLEKNTLTGVESKAISKQATKTVSKEDAKPATPKPATPKPIVAKSAPKPAAKKVANTATKVATKAAPQK